MKHENEFLAFSNVVQQHIQVIGLIIIIIIIIIMVLFVWQHECWITVGRILLANGRSLGRCKH